jgi:uncharacterized protein YdbL (DUF1318 family)
MKKASLVSLLLLSACVTINIYFPAAAADKVADEIIKGIQSDEGTIGTELGAESKLPPPKVNNAQIVFYTFLNLIIPVAHAEIVDLSVNTSEIRALRAAMHSRFSALKPYYSKGLVGIQRDGFLVVRGSVPLKDRNKLNRLLDAENNDRKKLYQAIANSNGHPEWFEQIKATFATRWISNAKSKWWIQSSGGTWVQK